MTTNDPQRPPVGDDALGALIGLAQVREPVDLCIEALRLLAPPPITARLLAGGRIWPGGEGWSLPAPVRAEALASGRGPLAAPDLPPGLDRTRPYEALALAEDVFLVRPSEEENAPAPTAYLVGAIVGLALRATAKADERATEPSERAFLAEIGRLALPLNHDLRNPLCAILLHAHLLLEDGDPDEATRARARSIIDNADRIRLELERLAEAKRELKATAAAERA